MHQFSTLALTRSRIGHLFTLLSCLFFIASCGSSGGGSPEPKSTPTSTASPAPTTGPSPTPSPSSVDSLEISGTLTYEYVPHLDYGALDYGSSRPEPIKGVQVLLLDAQGNTVAKKISNDEGEYRFDVNQNTAYRVRVLSVLERTQSPSWSITVMDNTEDEAVFALEGDLLSSGMSDSVRDLHAGSGWSVGAYVEVRSAGPFAIVDSVYEVLKYLSDNGFQEDLPATKIGWSERNSANDGEVADGNIGTSFFDVSSTTMYILGDDGNDTDEYDRSVVQHEFGHYLEDAISRSDSIGGSHSGLQKLDSRLAFSEGFASALTAYISGTGYYEDSSGMGQNRGYRESLENITANRGWYSEASVSNIVLDIADSENEAGDTLSLGFLPVLSSMANTDYKEASAFTSIYLFTDVLKADQDSTVVSAIETLMQAHDIYGEGQFGAGETNDGGVSVSLPVYHQLVLGGTVNVCSRGDDNNYFNALPVRRYVRFTVVNAGRYEISIVASDQGTGEKDPDAVIYRSGLAVSILDSEDVNREMRNLVLLTGEHIIDVYEYANSQQNEVGGVACFDMAVRELN